MHSRHLMTLLAGVSTLCACSKPVPPLETPPLQPGSAAGVVVSAPVDAVSPWLGHWQGPEGTYLDITGGPGSYRVAISNLDGPRTFNAKASSEALVLLRDGTTETLRPGNGVDTGMKWLAAKRDCLVVKTGEGYCRD